MTENTYFCFYKYLTPKTSSFLTEKYAVRRALVNGRKKLKIRSTFANFRAWNQRCLTEGCKNAGVLMAGRGKL
jgi:hypothetical protein